MRFRRTWFAVAGAVALTLSLAACGDSGSETSVPEDLGLAEETGAVEVVDDETTEPDTSDDEPFEWFWHETIDEWLADPRTPDFVRAVLADGQVTAGEVMEAESRVIECLASHGVESEYRDDEFGARELSATVPEQYQGDFTYWDTVLWPRLIQACVVEFMGPISWLYNEAHRNPDGQDHDEQVHACLIRHGIIPETISMRELNEEILAIWRIPESCADAQRHPGIVNVVCHADGTFDFEYSEEMYRADEWGNEGFWFPPVTLPDGRVLHWDDESVTGCRVRPDL